MAGGHNVGQNGSRSNSPSCLSGGFLTLHRGEGR